MHVHSVSPLSVGRLSEECEYFAYGLSSSGSDWVTIHFIKADDLTKLPDTLERVKFSCLAWTHDAKGIFYNSYPRQEGKTDGEHLFEKQPNFWKSFEKQTTDNLEIALDVDCLLTGY